MIDIKNIKVGDKVKVTEDCAYCEPGNMHTGREVNPGDLGEVVEIETSPVIVHSGWPLRVLLEGHEEPYLFAEVELDYLN